MFDIDSILIRKPEWFIKKHLGMFFGKNSIPDDDLFGMMIRESERIALYVMRKSVRI